MIEFIDTKDDARYASSNVAVNITHTLKMEQVKDLLLVIQKKYGTEWVRDVLCMGDVDFDGPFMVAVEGGRAPTFVHYAENSAHEEAHRLLRKTGARKATILVPVAVIQRDECFKTAKWKDA